MATVTRWLLILGMAFTATTKLASGHVDRFSLPEWLFYSTAIAELFLVVALLRRQDVLGAIGVIALSAGGLWVAFEVPGECGCLGRWVVVSRTHHVVAASAFGVLAGLLLVSTPGARAGMGQTGKHAVTDAR